MSDRELGPPPQQPPPRPNFWYTKAPLYHSEDYSSGQQIKHRLKKIFFPEITIDCYCPACNEPTVFQPVEPFDMRRERLKNLLDSSKRIYYAHFKCGRNDCVQELYFIFHLKGGTVTKVGQYPSIGDLVKPSIQRYRKVLSKDQTTDWQRAVGLSAHGIGAGSFVYLRRVIEQLINGVFEKAKSESNIDTEKYKSSRWPEKIKILQDYLPDFLTENALIYSILSKGVHELSEKECSSYFDIMHTSIEIICDEQLLEFERQEKAKKGSAAIQKIHQTLKTKG